MNIENIKRNKFFVKKSFLMDSFLWMKSISLKVGLLSCRRFLAEPQDVATSLLCCHQIYISTANFELNVILIHHHLIKSKDLFG